MASTSSFVASWPDRELSRNGRFGRPGITRKAKLRRLRMSRRVARVARKRATLLDARFRGHQTVNYAA